MGHESKFDKYQLTWHIEDEQQLIHRLELDEIVWPKEVDPETGLRASELVKHGFWRFQIAVTDSTVDVVDLECTIDQECFHSELARMRQLAQEQALAYSLRFSAKASEED